MSKRGCLTVIVLFIVVGVVASLVPKNNAPRSTVISTAAPNPATADDFS